MFAVRSLWIHRKSHGLRRPSLELADAQPFRRT
jgi:hypothetical protein